MSASSLTKGSVSRTTELEDVMPPLGCKYKAAVVAVAHAHLLAEHVQRLLGGRASRSWQTSSRVLRRVPLVAAAPPTRRGRWRGWQAQRRKDRGWHVTRWSPAVVRRGRRRRGRDVRLLAIQ